jgi:hypothetical protein
LRAGLLIFVGIFIGLGFLASWIVPKIFHIKPRPSLDPVGTISDELQVPIPALVATWAMARIPSDSRKSSCHLVKVRHFTNS